MASLKFFWAIAPLGVGLILASPAAADLAAAEAAIAAKKYDAAIAELQPLAEGGDGYAKWKLAQLYLAGHGGSVAEGMTLLQQAAEAGEPEAQSRLGVLYAKGEGVPQSDTEAYKWLSLAARGASPGVSRLMAETNQSIVAQRMTAEQRAVRKDTGIESLDVTSRNTNTPCASRRAGAASWQRQSTPSRKCSKPTA